jgi:hypothetical protein
VVALSLCAVGVDVESCLYALELLWKERHIFGVGVDKPETVDAEGDSAIR